MFTRVLVNVRRLSPNVASFAQQFADYSRIKSQIASTATLYRAATNRQATEVQLRRDTNSIANRTLCRNRNPASVQQMELALDRTGSRADVCWSWRWSLNERVTA